MRPFRTIYSGRSPARQSFPVWWIVLRSASFFVALFACCGVIPQPLAMSTRRAPSFDDSMKARTVAIMSPCFGFGGWSERRSSISAISMRSPSSPVSMRIPNRRAAVVKECCVLCVAGQTTIISPDFSFRSAASTGLRLSSTVDSDRGRNWISISGLNHTRTFADVTGTVSLDSPFAFISESSARLYFSGRSTCATFIEDNASVGTLARRISVAFIRGNASRESVDSRIWQCFMFVFHAFSIFNSGIQKLSGINPREVRI